MATAEVKERLAQDVGQWLTDGLVDPATAAVLRERWDQPGLGLRQALRFAGNSGAMLFGLGLLGLLGGMLGNRAADAVGLTGLAAALLWFGVRAAREPTGRQEQLSRQLLVVGFCCLAAGAALAGDGAGLGGAATAFVVGLCTLPVAFGLAYAFRIRYVLVLGLLGLYAWIGSWTSMLGASTYAFAVEDPRLMAVAALAGAAVGAAHERLWPRALPTFPAAWIAVALTYLNLSLLILTISTSGGEAAAWIVVWALAGLGQLLAGARLQRAGFTGFGVTALALNLFTRYSERFWSGLDAGLFFLLGGGALFGAGLLLERWLVARSRAGAVGGAGAAGGAP